MYIYIYIYMYIPCSRGPRQVQGPTKQGHALTTRTAMQRCVGQRRQKEHDPRNGTTVSDVRRRVQDRAGTSGLWQSWALQTVTYPM
jgi:hypothetical protein